MNQHRPEIQKAVVRWIFGGGFTFLGLLFLVIGGFEFQQGLKTNDWPAAAGRLIASEVTDYPGTDYEYTVSVRYSYEIDGREFEGDRLRFGNETHNSWALAKDEQLLYPPGKEVQVYYDPKTPNRSVLIKGIGLSWMMMALGLMALVIGLVVMFHMARARTAKIK